MRNLLALVFGLIAASSDVICYLINGGSTLSELAVPFLLLRYGAAYVGALLVGYLASRIRAQYWLLLVVPPLIAGNTLFLYQLGQISNLWPPILIIDILLFLPCLPIMGFGKQLASWRADRVRHD